MKKLIRRIRVIKESLENITDNLNEEDVLGPIEYMEEACQYLEHAIEELEEYGQSDNDSKELDSSEFDED
ncbi:MAG: hypothetical protein HGA35_03240 [Erysipelotrichaceae bacterium]|nr:hypothetical protein [Erysipelotrichaceae bacterium]